MSLPSGVVALSNNAPPHDKNNPPPEGLSWGDGELKAPKRARALSPDVKGVFTESVIARLPEMQVEEDAVAQLFASDTRMPAPSLTPPPPARPNAFWHEPGNTLQAGVPGQPAKPRVQPSPAAAAALIAGAATPRAAAEPNAAPAKRPPMPGAPSPRLPAGALGAPVVAPDGFSSPTPARGMRRNSLPAGALREGRTAKQPEPAPQAAAHVEVPIQGGRTIELGDNTPSGLDLDIPAANTNASRSTSGAPAPRGRPQIQAVIDKEALSGGAMRADPAPSMRTGAGAVAAPSASLRAAGPPADASSMRASGAQAGVGASLRAAADGLATSTPMRASGPQVDVAASLPAAADGLATSTSPRASGDASASLQPAGSPVASGSLRADEPVTASRASRANAPGTSLRAGGEPPPLAHAATPQVEWSDSPGATARGAETSSFPPDEAGPKRPKSGKERRAEARRAARRKAAKHLPPPPPTARKPAWDPARITLVSFAAVLGLGALGIGAAEAGLWELPPRAAAMLGVENARASLSSAKPGEKPHLVMPAEPKAATPPSAPQPVAPLQPMAAEELADELAADPAEPQLNAAEPAATAAPEAAANRELGLIPPPGAIADYSSAAAWGMVPAEELPAPVLRSGADSSAAAPRAVAPAESALQPSGAAPGAPAGPQAAAATTADPNATPQPLPPAAPGKPTPMPGTISAAAAAPPRVSPEAAAELEDVADESASAATPGDRAVSAKLVALARAKLKARDAAGAAKLMLRQVTSNPEDHHAMEVLIRAWIAMGRGEDAVGYAELIVKKRPRRAAYRVLEGDARLAAGDAAGAQVAWRVALQLEPENIEAKRRLGLQ